MALFLRFLFLATLRVLARVFYRHDYEWVPEEPKDAWKDVRVCLLLNHTSLFEAVLSGAFPLRFVWDVAERGLLPGADTTMDRPIVGLIFKWMVPNWVSITRRLDSTWEAFLNKVGPDTMVLMFPEGRMRRRGGFDKHGRPMTVRGGIADVLSRVSDGSILLVHSEGLHHIHAPGDTFPKLFRQVRCRLEQFPVAEYKKQMGFGEKHFRRNIMHDLERRRDLHCAWDEKSLERGGPKEGEPGNLPGPFSKVPAQRPPDEPDA